MDKSPSLVPSSHTPTQFARAVFNKASGEKALLRPLSVTDHRLKSSLLRWAPVVGVTHAQSFLNGPPRRPSTITPGVQRRRFALNTFPTPSRPGFNSSRLSTETTSVFKVKIDSLEHAPLRGFDLVALGAMMKHCTPFGGNHARFKLVSPTSFLQAAVGQSGYGRVPSDFPLSLSGWGIKLTSP